MIPTNIDSPSCLASPTDRSIGNVEPSLRSAKHFAADADDLALAGLEKIADIAVVLDAIRRRHQHLDVLPDHFVGAIFEQLLAGRIEHQDRSRAHRSG